MSITVQHKRDTASNWTSNNPTLAAGEFGFETDTGKLKVGDGSTAWSSLNYFEAVAGYAFQGSTSGYTSGGSNPTLSNVIDKFSFSSDGNATDVGDLTAARSSLAGQSSTSNGYNSSGYGPANSNVIDKFPFSSDANATDVGDGTVARLSLAGGNSSETNGYTAGGYCSPPFLRLNVIDKFPFSSDANATDVGDLTVARTGAGGQSYTNTNGYNTGGYDGTAVSNVIDKFPFSSDANATDVGDLICRSNLNSGQSSSTHGYNSGGRNCLNAQHNTIQKFSFSSDGNSTDAADLTVGRQSLTGQSATSSGYASGGTTSFDIIDKFPFSSDSNATDIGNLSSGRGEVAGQQV